MPSVLAVAPGTPAALRGRRLAATSLTLDVIADPEAVLRDVATTPDLLVLCDMTVDEQQQFAAALQQQRRWRLVPILYVLDARTPGFAIPGTFRPEIDGIARGPLESHEVQQRIHELAREGTAGAELVVAGPCELDPVRGTLRIGELEIELTHREADILSILLSQPNKTVTASEIIERSWGVTADERHLQILRRHISNIRRKLFATPVERHVRTVRGYGYRFDVRQVS